MKYRNQIPDHVVKRAAARCSMLDGKDNDFKRDLCEEWNNAYRGIGVPDNLMNEVRSISTRVREFFGWEISLSLVRAYRNGDEQKFHQILKEFFHNSDDTYRGSELEMCFDQIPMNKTIEVSGIIAKIRSYIINIQVNEIGKRNLTHWLGEQSYEFYKKGNTEMNTEEVLKAMYPSV